MLQVIKFTFFESIDLIESKCEDFMKNQSKDLDSEFSVPSIINKTLENVCVFDIDEKSFMFVMNKGDHLYLLGLLKKANVKFIVEDKTNLYYENKLSSLVPDDQLEKFNESSMIALSVDDVLDKISKSGIDSLSSVDRLILERN